jgi:cobalt-zinc-cadmium efflux system protein
MTHAHGPQGHHHDYKASEKKHLRIALAVNSAVMLLEFIGGVVTGSLALLSDAGHMFTHIFALATSLIAILLASRIFTDRRSFGYYRAEILATFVNSLFLFFVVIGIAYEAILHLLHPAPIRVKEMIGIAVIGLAANLISFFILRKDSERDINIRAAFLHVLSDTLSSVFIILGGIAMYFKGWAFIDPLLGLGISLLILIWAWRLFRDSVDILLEAAPKEIDIDVLKKTLRNEIPQIRELHDIHLWVITSHLFTATLHVFLEDMTIRESEAVVARIQDVLRNKFSISHATIQIETLEEACRHREGIGECRPGTRAGANGKIHS